MKSSMGITKELQICLSLSVNLALDLRHPLVTIDHLLLGLVSNPEVAKALRDQKGNVELLRKLILSNLDALPTIPVELFSEFPRHSKEVEDILLRARAKINKRLKLSVMDVFTELYNYNDPITTMYFESIGLTSFEKPQKVAIATLLVETPKENTSPPLNTKKFLKEYGVDLNLLASKGKIDPLMGRDKEVDRVIHILSRRKKNNPLLIGEPGVGKTAIVEGLAYRIFKKEVPESLQNCKIYNVEISNIIAGTSFRGQFEDRLRGLINDLKSNPDCIVFMDEIHTIMGAGATSGSSLDASNILKPALADGSIRCIGATTFEENRKFIEKDKALSRRFQSVTIEEPSAEDCLSILKGLKLRYERFHNITYTDDALEAAIKLSVRYMPDRHLPDKAIDLIDEAGAKEKLNPKSTGMVGVSIIEEMISRISGVTVQNLENLNRKILKTLEADLQSHIFGQDTAINSLASSIKLAKTGLRAKNKPIGSFLFVGPTGVGKTELSRQLAEVLHYKFIRYDMSEFSDKHSTSKLIGSPPGYVGYDEGSELIETIRKNPNSVIVFDEIEKANPALFNLLLQIMDNATITDSTGKKADFRNSVIILTSNVGVRELAKKSMGFSSSTDEVDISKLKKALELTFSPEFRNRLDGIISFGSLSRDSILKVVDKEIKLLQEALKEHYITIKVNSKAKNWLAEKGYSFEFGARNMSRVFETEVKKPISEMLVREEVGLGGCITLGLTDNNLTFKAIKAKIETSLAKVK